MSDGRQHLAGSQGERALLPPPPAPGKARDPGDQAARQPARPGARLFAGRRRRLRGDRGRSRRGREPAPSRQNLVAVISNGTAVLGLGDIGPLASKPVMEGKAVLFKKFAGIDVFDIEVDGDGRRHAGRRGRRARADLRRHQPRGHQGAGVLRGRGAAARRAWTFRSSTTTSTAPRSSSARRCINALELAGKRIDDVKIVTSGAGAAALACLNLLVSLGAQAREHLGHRHRGRRLRGPRRR